MQIELCIANETEFAHWYDVRNRKLIDTISMFAPVKKPTPESDGGDHLGFRAEGLGPHGAYEDSTGGRDFFAPVIPGDFAFPLIYPLDKPALVKVTDAPEGGFTIADLITIVQRAYEGIYQIEEYAEEGEDLPEGKLRLRNVTFLNRPQTEDAKDVLYKVTGHLEVLETKRSSDETDVQFSAWGHGIEELAIEAIDVAQLSSGEYTIEVHIGS